MTLTDGTKSDVARSRASIDPDCPIAASWTRLRKRYLLYKCARKRMSFYVPFALYNLRNDAHGSAVPPRVPFLSILLSSDRFRYYALLHVLEVSTTFFIKFSRVVVDSEF